MKDKAVRLWGGVLKKLKDRISDSDFSSWISNVTPYDIEDFSSEEDMFVVEVDSNFIRDKVEKEFKSMILEILNELYFDKNYIGFKINIKEKSKESRDSLSPSSSYDSVKSEPTQPSLTPYRDRSFSVDTAYNLNNRYIFSTFVVGKNNEFAHAAAEAVSKSPGKRYNPLFIYGGVGLGKTHLMHAIGNAVYEKDKSKRVYYCSSEQFTNDMINSLKNDKMVEFKEKYRNLDILLIDDIQFISGKESTQEEFFHTFNTLHNEGKQIVISSDRPPKEMDNIEKRLVSRFEWGLITDIQQPDYETRVAILKKKCELDEIEVSEEVLRYIAEAVNSNIRELEGALNRVVAKSSFSKKEITVELVEEMFYDVLKTRSKMITKEKIIKVVSEWYNISEEDMKSTKRKKEIAKARQVSMFLLRDTLQLPFMAIGEVFGGKDHTTVMHSVTKVEEDMKSNKYFAKEITNIKEKIMS